VTKGIMILYSGQKVTHNLTQDFTLVDILWTMY